MSRAVDSGDQVDSLPEFFSDHAPVRSTDCSFLKTMPARMSRSRLCVPSHHVFCAASNSLNAVVSSTVREPASFDELLHGGLATRPGLHLHHLA